MVLGLEEWFELAYHTCSLSVSGGGGADRSAGSAPEDGTAAEGSKIKHLDLSKYYVFYTHQDVS